MRIGSGRLWDWMRENGYIFKHSCEPTQKSMDMKLFEVIERTVQRSGHAPIITRTTKVTGKGQQCMKLPKQLYICGIKFEIVEKSVICKGEAGLTRGIVNFVNDTIEIYSELSDDRKVQILIHECLHAILDLSGNKNICEDEKAVQSIATAMYCTLKENDLLSFL